MERQIVEVKTYVDMTDGPQRGADIQTITNVETGKVTYLVTVPMPDPNQKRMIPIQIEIENVNSVVEAFDKREDCIQEYMEYIKERASFPRLAVAHDMDEAEQLKKGMSKLITP